MSNIDKYGTLPEKWIAILEKFGIGDLRVGDIFMTDGRYSNAIKISEIFFDVDDGH